MIDQRRNGFVFVNIERQHFKRVLHVGTWAPAGAKYTITRCYKFLSGDQPYAGRRTCYQCNRFFVFVHDLNLPWVRNVSGFLISNLLLSKRNSLYLQF